jgi:hypothetical protein
MHIHSHFFFICLFISLKTFNNKKFYYKILNKKLIFFFLILFFLIIKKKIVEGVYEAKIFLFKIFVHGKK